MGDDGYHARVFAKATAELSSCHASWPCRSAPCCHLPTPPHVTTTYGPRPSPSSRPLQLCTLEFQKDEMSNQDEFEREAREFAEAQLAAAQAELAAMRSARAADQAEIGRLQEVVAKVQGEAAAALQAKDGEQLAVQEQLVQVRGRKGWWLGGIRVGEGVGRPWARVCSV